MKTVNKIETRGAWNKGKHYSTGPNGGGYQAVHKWLNKYYGKADRCELDTCRGKSKMYHWAKRQGFFYEHKRENFIMLCASCHRVYDQTSELLTRLKTIKRERYAKLVIQFSITGILVKKWASLGQIQEDLGFNRANISQVCNGKRKTAHGFIWRYK